MSETDRLRAELRISCSDALELMTAHLEGALSEADGERMRAHLAGCEPCSVFCDQLRKTVMIAAESGTAEEYRIDPARIDGLIEAFRAHRSD